MTGENGRRALGHGLLMTRKLQAGYDGQHGCRGMQVEPALTAWNGAGSLMCAEGTVYVASVVNAPHVQAKPFDYSG